MENYIVSARKYRPTTFSSVVGQKALTATLKNAIATDRLAHAYLFCGSRGVGKTSCARIFAKSINCEHPTPEGDPCNECASCRAFNESRSLNIMELDAASNNSVDDIRALVDQVQVSPTEGRYRVFIIDEVHMLSSSAFNAFLKTLEEPPSYVVFILATTEKHKIIPTILSRCQIYDFNRITVADMVDHLAYVASQEGIAAERSALNIIARKADGAMRDALSIFDQVAASSRGQITYASTIANLNVLDSAYYSRLVEAFIAQNVSEALMIYKEIRDRGFDSHFFVIGLAAYLRDLMVARDPQTASLVDTDDDVRRQMAELAAKVPVEFFYKAMSLCNDADLNYRQASSKTFLVELLLIKLCQLLSPSPIFDGNGEGQLKPIAVDADAPVQGAAPSPAPAATHASSPGGASGGVQQAPAPAAPPLKPRGEAPASVPTAAANTAAAAPAPRPTGAPPIGAPAAAPRPSRPAKVLMSTAAVFASPKAETEKVAEPQQGKRFSRYSDEDVSNAWDSFATAHSREHVLNNTMRACRPERREPDRYHVTVQNEKQIEVLTDALPSLLKHLRDTLRNDSIELSFSISDTGPAPRVMSDREVIAYLTEKNPELAEAMNVLKLKLI